MNRITLAACSLPCAFALALIGCGDKTDESATRKDDVTTGPPAAPIAMPALGVDQIKRFNFVYEAGAPAHEKAAAAYRRKDWAAVRTQAEAALAKDPMHFGSHRLLAAALAQTGEPAAAVDHLVTAIAADDLLYTPTLVDDDLKELMASQHGRSVRELAAKIRGELTMRIATGLWLVGRRSPFKWPRELGVQTSTSRGELYAFDRETRRYFRLTHTDHQVFGFVRPPVSPDAAKPANGAPAGEVAIVGFDRIERPRPDAVEGKPEIKPDAKTDAKPDARTDAKADAKPNGKPADAAGSGSSATAPPPPPPPPLLARAWVQLYDTVEWKPLSPRITLPAAREIAIGYAAGNQLLVSTAPATGRWTVGEPTISSIDRTTGKLTKVTAAMPARRLVVSLDEGALVRVPDEVSAAWAGEPPVAPSLQVAGGKTIRIPESGATAQSTVALAPGGAHLAFATAVDPCAKDAAPSLYVADTKTGTAAHLLSAKSRFANRWLDATTLAYEDGDGAIRLWDATTGREALRLENKSGLALDVLSLAAAPLCKQAPPTVEAGTGGASDDALPPEEPAAPANGEPAQGSGSSGPVTAPR